MGVAAGWRLRGVNRTAAGDVHLDVPSPPPKRAEPVTPEQRLMTSLHDEHAGVLYAFVLRYVDDRDQARDVVQETLLRAWRHLDQLDQGDPRSYLFTVARNLVTDQWRTAQRRPRLVHDDAAMDADRAPDQLDGAIDGWLVTDALERLTPEHRVVIEALYYRGASVAAAAVELGLPEGTVKSRSYYAVRALRSTFEEMGVLR